MNIDQVRWYQKKIQFHPVTSLLKMICNDFLVVKVNCWSYVFNIIQSIRILRNIKDKKIGRLQRERTGVESLDFLTLWSETSLSSSPVYENCRSS